MSADPDFFIEKKLAKTKQGLSFFDPAAIAEYKRYFRDPATVHAMCEDYRACAGIDFDMDTRDFEAGRKIACPVLLLWGATGGVGRNSKPSPGEIWQRYAADIRGAKALPCGHYLSEEAPEETYNELRRVFLHRRDELAGTNESERYGCSNNLPNTSPPLEHFVRPRRLGERQPGVNARMKLSGRQHVDQRAHAGAALLDQMVPGVDGELPDRRRVLARAAASVCRSSGALPPSAAIDHQRAARRQQPRLPGMLGPPTGSMMASTPRPRVISLTRSPTFSRLAVDDVIGAKLAGEARLGFARDHADDVQAAQPWPGRSAHCPCRRPPHRSARSGLGAARSASLKM